MDQFLEHLKQSKIVQWALAYIAASFAVIQVLDIVTQRFGWPTYSVRFIIIVLAAGFFAVLVVAWYHGERGAQRVSGTELLILALLFSIGGAVALRFAPTAAEQVESQGKPATTNSAAAAAMPADNKSIAVLPFVDLTQNKDQEYFGDGMSEELLSMLGKVAHLRVVARTSSFAFKNTAMDVREIGRRLNVGSVLEGTVRRDGHRVRITAELIEVAGGFDLWSETYERQIDDIFAVQDEITRAIVSALKAKLAIEVLPIKTVDNEAYDLYLQGVFFSNKSSEQDLRRSLDFFQRSLQKDPDNAKAWSGIAKVWLWLADAYVKPLDAYPASKAAALKAIALDAKNAEAHNYLAEAKRILDYDMTGALEELHRALQLDPNSSFAHLILGLNRSVQGFRTEGMEHIQEALRLDPLSPIISNFAAMSYVANGRYDDAIAEAKRVQQLDAAFVYEGSFMADAYREKGLYPEAIAAYRKAEQLTGEPQQGLAITYVRMGRVSEARLILAELEKRAAQGYVSADRIAAIYVALDDKDKAFRWLQCAFDEHAAPLQAIAVAAEFRPLRSDPRFATLLAALGLDAQHILASYASSNAP